MGGFLGKIGLLAPRSTYPLGFHHAARITDQRLALVGDAAHGIHPIAGQGLNLGFRDAAALAQVLVEGARLGLDLGDQQLLDRYQRWRSLDTFMVALATDSLTRIYGSPRQDRLDGPPLRHGPDQPHRAGQGPADGRSARHQRRPAAAAAGPADLGYVQSAKRLADVGAARRQALELHQLDDQVGAPGQVGSSSSACLAPTSNGATWAMALTSISSSSWPTALPVDRKPERIAEPPRLPLDIGALDEAQRRRLLIVEGGQVDIGLAVGGAEIALGDQPEAVRARAARC